MDSTTPQHKMKPAVPPKPSVRPPRPAPPPKGPARNLKSASSSASPVTKSSVPKHDGDGPAALPSSTSLHKQPVPHAVGASGPENISNSSNGVTEVQHRKTNKAKPGAEPVRNSCETAKSENVMADVVVVSDARQSLQDGDSKPDPADEENNNSMKAAPSMDPVGQDVTSAASSEKKAVSVSPASAAGPSDSSSKVVSPNKSQVNTKEAEDLSCISSEPTENENSCDISASASELRPRPVPQKRLSVKRLSEVEETVNSQSPTAKPLEKSDVTAKDLDCKTSNNASVLSSSFEGETVDDDVSPSRPPRRPKHLRKSYLKCRSATNLASGSGNEGNVSLTTLDDTFPQDEPQKAVSMNIKSLVSPPRNVNENLGAAPVRTMKNSKSDSQVNRLAANISSVVDLRLKEQLTSPGRPKPPVKPKPDKVVIKAQTKDVSVMESCTKPNNVEASHNGRPVSTEMPPESEAGESADVITPIPHRGIRVLPNSQREHDEYGHMWMASEGSNMSLSSPAGEPNMSQSMVEHSCSKPESKDEMRCQSMVFETETPRAKPLFLRTQSEQAIGIHAPQLPPRRAHVVPRQSVRSKCPAQRPTVPPPKAPPLLVPLSKKPHEKASDESGRVPSSPKEDSEVQDASHTNRESLYDAEGYLRPKSAEGPDDVYSYAQLPGQVASPDAIRPPPPVHPRPVQRPRSFSASPALPELVQTRGDTESSGSENSRDSHGNDKRHSFMGHFYEMIRSKSMKTKRKHEEPGTKSVFYCEADENDKVRDESQNKLEENMTTEKPMETSQDHIAPPLPARNSRPAAEAAVSVPSEKLDSPRAIKHNLPKLTDVTENPEEMCLSSEFREDEQHMEGLLDTPIIAPGEDDYDDTAAPGIEPYAATDIINNPVMDVAPDVSLDVEIPVPAGTAKRRRVNHGYTGEGNSSNEEEENPYDDTPDTDVVRNSFSTHTYEATSDMGSGDDSETDSDGYIYPDAQNLPPGRTEAPSGPPPPTPRHRDVPAPPPLPRRTTSVQSQPPPPHRSTSLQSQPIDPSMVNFTAEDSADMDNEYSEPKELCGGTSDSDSDIYDDTYSEPPDLHGSKQTTPEYHVYDASCSEARDNSDSEITKNFDSCHQSEESKKGMTKQTSSEDVCLRQQSSALQRDTTTERPESWTSSGSDQLTIASESQTSRFSGYSTASGSSNLASMSDCSEFDDVGSTAAMHKNDPKEQQAKHKTKAFHIVKEIMTTEQSFIRDLNLLKKFEESVLESFQSKPDLIQHVEKDMFKYLFELQKVNEDLLKDVSQRVDNWEHDPRIADIFVKTGPFLKLYTTYIREFKSCIAVFDEARRKWPEFDEFTQKFEASHCNKLDLKPFMGKPIQRLPQYKMLMEEYLKQLIEDTEEYRQTEAAIIIMGSVGIDANEGAKYRDNLIKLQEIKGMLIGDFEVIKPGREFIKEGILQKLSRKVMQPRMFFLCNDVLLITAHIPGGYKLKHVIRLTDLKVRTPQKEDFHNEFNLISPQRSFTVAASTPKERDEWVTVTQEAIDAVTGKRNTLGYKNPPAHGTTDPGGPPDGAKTPDAPNGSEPPVWVPDARVSMCMLCTAGFTIAFRRHHCRACGKIVCSHCSDYRAPLKYLDYKAARVCSVCFKTLENGAKDGSPLPDCAMERFKCSSFKHAKVKRSAVLYEVKANDEHAEMSGYLKVWKGNKWKKRWFVLKDKALFTFKASEDAAAVESQVLLGHEIGTFTTWFEGIEPRLIFEIVHHGTTEKTFRTESESSRDKWMAALQKATLP